MTIKVRMSPHASQFSESAPSGVQKVVQKYFEYLPLWGIELVAQNATSYDLLAIHAGAYDFFRPTENIIHHCHGLYWTDDYQASSWEQEGNQRVIDVLRHAASITVPSNWVAEAIQRDMHTQPTVVPHGVDVDEWQGAAPEDYILWNKNRRSDACDPTPVNELAKLMPKQRFITTYAAAEAPRNVRAIGTVPHRDMQRVIKGARLYLGTTKETFGIGTLEAMAAGVPVLGFDWGGTSDLVTHGVTGYLASPGDYEDLREGADYLLRHHARISAAARQAAKRYSWEAACHDVAQVYADTLKRVQQPRQIGVVIPCYNKAATLERAVRSVLNQSHLPDFLVVVDNNSTDRSAEIAHGLGNQIKRGDQPLHYMLMGGGAQGVAHARNQGIAELRDCTYIVCLDADDEMAPEFINTCLAALERDTSLAIAYTGLMAVNQKGQRSLSEWPGDYNYDQFLTGHNQVPTCCMFRREFWQRAGGFRQRYAPGGAGAEDADLWLRIGALGGRGEKVSDEGLFIYHLGGQVSGDPNYREVNWRADKPWIEDGRHPFASVATPENQVAHLVRQVDQPLVSIVIPCGPGHGVHLADCLDSIESQRNRQWEAIVVADLEDREFKDVQTKVNDSYPFVRLYRTANPGSGAGAARNAGASRARSPLLLFLDVDDTLPLNALNRLLEGYAQNPLSVVYGDYVGHAYLTNAHEVERLRQQDRVISYDPKSMLTAVRYRSLDYDCARALQQPDARRPYIWNVISSLLPTSFHEEIGGFDEAMESWEDWDYWLRMARVGKCFTRINTPTLEYRFYTGKRRALANPTESGDNGRQLSEKLLSYMRNKYEGIEVMPCRSCGGGRSRKATPPSPSVMARSMNEGETAKLSGQDLVWVVLIDGNVGSHKILFQGEFYGYHSSGEVFKYRADHVKLDNRVRLATPQEIAEATGDIAPAEPAYNKVADIEPWNLPPKRRPLPLEPEPEVAGWDAQERPDMPAMVDEAQEDEAVGNELSALGLNSETTARIVTPEGQEVKGEVGEGVTLVPTKRQFDFTQIWGIGPDRQSVLLGKGVRSLTGLIALDVPGIASTLGVPKATAERVLKSAQDFAAK